MDRTILFPSKVSESPPERTLKLLHERLDQAEEEAKKLSEQLSEYGFNAGADGQGGSGQRSAVKPVSPFAVTASDGGEYQLLKRNYEQLVSRVCRTESIVQSLKLALVSLEAENSLINKQSVAGTLSANEAYEKELMKLKKDLVSARRQLDESERFRAQTELDFQRLREHIGAKTASNASVVEKVQEFKVTREKLTKRVNELREELGHEKNVRHSLESSHQDLLDRVTEMEKIVEKENQEMKLLSGDCTRLKHELSQTRTNYDREYQTRMQVETLVERLSGELGDMESKLLNISNERKTIDSELLKLKRENKDQKQQLDMLRKSNETLKKVNLDLEHRYKEINKVLHITTDDNKILIAQHRDSVEKERLVFAEKLKEQDKLLDQAKESMLQELAKEKQDSAMQEKEIAKLKAMLASLQDMLQDKESELSKLKDILAKLTEERDKMMKENDQTIFEIRRDLDNFLSEKVSLEAQLGQQKVLEFSCQDSHQKLQDESRTVKERNERLEEENAKMRTRLMEVEYQQTNQDRVNTALHDMLEDKRRLAYEKGVLQSQVEKLHLQVVSQSETKAENEKLKRAATAAENRLHELQSVVSDKGRAIQLLMRNKDEALKETERVIRQMDTYERKYAKKVDSLQTALVQSKEDNKKLAGTLEAVITSHTQLQASFEQLQTELGKRDSQAKYAEEERSKTQAKMGELTREVERLQNKLMTVEETESSEMDLMRNAVQALEDDRGKLMDTVEPLVKANRDLHGSLETLAKEVGRKDAEIKKLQEALEDERNEVKVENVAKESKLEEIQKQYEKEMKEMRIKYKKETAKLRKELQDLLNLKNVFKDENGRLKRERQEEEERHKKLREKLRVSKSQLEQCLKHQTTQEREAEVARQKIEAMSRDLAALENLKTQYTKNNAEQARSLQEFISQLSELQDEFRSLSKAQQQTSFQCRQKDEEINLEKLKRKEMEALCHKLKNREKQLRKMQNDTERQLQEANFESQQVASNLHEAHQWFKNKFTDLQSELNKSRKVQSVLQKDNVDQYMALQEERRRAEEATERAKEIIKDIQTPRR